MATGTSGDDRDDLESRTDDTAATTEPTIERDDVDADEVTAEASGETGSADDADASEVAAAKADKKQRKAAEKKATEKKGKKTPKRSDAETHAAAGERKGIGAFFGQVIEELKKVVTPTGKELWRYVGVVLSFLLIMMLLVLVLDWAFGFISSWIFGEGTHLFPQNPPAPSPTPGVPTPTP